MAILRRFHTSDGKVKKYIEKEEVYQVVRDLIKQCTGWYVYGTLDLGVRDIYTRRSDGFVHHMMDVQDSADVYSNTRLVHFVVDLFRADVKGKTVHRDLLRITHAINHVFFYQFQHITILRNNGYNYEIHMLINPINIETSEVFNLNKPDFKKFIMMMDILLHMTIDARINNINDNMKMYDELYIEVSRNMPSEMHMALLDGEYNYKKEVV